MTEYQAPIDDTLFMLDAVADLDEVLALEAFDPIDRDLVTTVVAEAGRITSEVLAPLNRVGDTEGSRLENGSVVTPSGWVSAYRQFCAGGWGSLPIEAEYGGGGLPWLISNCVQEFACGANISFGLAPLLSQSATDMLLQHGSETLREIYLPHLVDGSWGGTMNLTEPEAGSDVGALRCRAERADDGTYRITGTKIFITYGDHDLTDNIVHMVLARTPDAPPGTKGISCFVVPKYLVNDDGTLGERNDVHCVSLEHKLGIHASPTCVMSFGEADGAVGYLIGEENHGMRYMFTMMNIARLAVGVQSIGVADRAYQQAVSYAKERTQGRAIGSDDSSASPIIEHADVRRMLLDMRAHLEAMRGLVMLNGAAIDKSAHAIDDVERQRADDRAALLTPISKSWSTDTSVEVTSTAIQVHGGMGYVEETGVAQQYRDVRITPIYEGTNGIQAMDLVARKLPMRSGEVIAELFADITTDVERLAERSLPTGPLATNMTRGIEVARETTAWMLATLGTDPVDAFAGATAYQSLLGILVGGYVHTRSALAAAERLEADPSDTWASAKLTTARYFGEQVLPKIDALAAAVTAGSDVLFAIEGDDW